MTHPRNGAVRETAEELHYRQRQSALHLHAARIRMLILILEDPAVTNLALADELGCSKSTIKRWWGLYQKHGLSRLIDDQRSTGTSLSMRDQIGIDTVVRFLNRLPTALTTLEWSTQFSSALTGFLGDVDRVSTVANVGCDLQIPESYNPGVASMGHAPSTGPGRIVSATTDTNDIVDRLLLDFDREGFPFAEYNKPHAMVLRYLDDAYLGTVILWRRSGRQDISARTLELFYSLKPFFEFMLADCVVRDHYARPHKQEFEDRFAQLVTEIGLSEAETRVALALILGNRQKHMAEMLSLSISTIKTHLQSIYRKGGVTTALELVARMNTPRRSTDLSDDTTEEG